MVLLFPHAPHSTSHNTFAVSSKRSAGKFTHSANPRQHGGWNGIALPCTATDDAFPDAIATQPPNPNDRRHSHYTASTSTTSSTDSDSEYTSSDEDPAVTPWGATSPSRGPRTTSHHHHYHHPTNKPRGQRGGGKPRARPQHKHKRVVGLSQPPHVLVEVASAMATRLQQIPTTHGGEHPGGQVTVETSAHVMQVVQQYIVKKAYVSTEEGNGVDDAHTLPTTSTTPHAGGGHVQLVDPTPHDLGFVLEEISRKAGMQLVIHTHSALHTLGHPTNHPTVLSSVLWCCDRWGAGRAARAVLDEAQCRGMEVQVEGVNYAMAAMGKDGMVEEAVVLFKDMTALYNATPDIHTYASLLLAYEKARMADKAWEVYERMKREGMKITNHAYRALLSVLQGPQYTTQAAVVLDDLLQPSCRTAISSQLCRVIWGLVFQNSPSKAEVVDMAKRLAARSAWMSGQDVERLCSWSTRTKQYHVCFLAVEAMRQYGVLADKECLPSLYHRVLSLCNGGSMWQEAVTVLSWVDHESTPTIRVSEVTRLYQKVLSICTHANQPTPAHQLFTTMHARQYTPLPWKEVIVCLAQHHQWEAVMKLLEQMHAAVDLQACGDSSVHTMLVALATRGGNPQQAWQVYQQMVNDKVPVQQATWNALITACAAAGDPSRARDFFDAMRASSNATPNVKTYTAMITVHERLRDWRGAQAWWEAMLREGIQPDTVCYNAMLSALEKGGQVDAALDLFHSMRKAGLQASSTTYATLVEVFTQQDKWDLLQTALQVKEWLEAQGVDPETSTYQSLLHEYGRDGQWEEVLSLFEQISAMYSHIQPDTTTYGSVLIACARVGDLTRALEVKATMESSHVPHNAYTYNALLAAAEEAARLDVALELLDEMQASGVAPDVVSYTTAISCCNKAGGQWETAVQLVSQMQAAGLQPSLITYNALLAVLATAGEWQRALRLFHHVTSTTGGLGAPEGTPPEPLPREGPRSALPTPHTPNPMQQRWITYSTTIEALASAAQWATAAALLRRATAEGVASFLRWECDAEIDLHLLTERGAEVVVRCWLQHLREEDRVHGRRVTDEHVWIITGWGRHSKGDPVIKPRIASLLGSELGAPLAFSEPDNNPGTLRIATEELYTWLALPDVKTGLEE